jgi:hypothetical protein
VIPLLQKFDLGPKLGFFIGDNIGTNNTAVRCILKELRPDIEDPDSRRVRCIGHIINLVARAFLFGKDAESLEAEDLSKAQISKLLAVRKDWLNNGPYGKLYKTVNFIRDTPQRRDKWFAITNYGVDEEFEGMSISKSMPRLRSYSIWKVCRQLIFMILDLIVIANNKTRWNTVYLSITRAITLYPKIQVFSEVHRDELETHFLLTEDWDVLK